MRAVNLIPADQRGGGGVGAGRSQGVVYAVLALVAGIAILAFLYGRASHEVSGRRNQAQQLSAQAARAKQEASELAPYTSFVALREQRVQAVSALVDSRFDWAHVMHEFGRVLPAGVSLSSVTGSVGSATGSSSTSANASGAPAAAGSSSVTSATPPGSVPVFTVTGCATSQPVVALMLERLRLMDGVSDVTLQSSTKATGSGGGGSCPGSDPSFAVGVTFDGLPASSAIQTATATDASNSSGGAR